MNDTALTSPLQGATVYTQVIELPHPNPPLGKGRELDFLVSPLYKGGLRGVKPGYQSNYDLYVHVSLQGEESKIAPILPSLEGPGGLGSSRVMMEVE
ncbi:hypothetical protein IQ274_10860 [Nostoc sp. LEGE 12447]|uniref:hypothetical protein n=1 Tax=Nostoc sp. LEGE 12447 TaxID=1828640 RepID=UPI00188385D4|nr:hypothetical protein [Nostoc sp. LEGE 12447]MBE8998700.1 hypothetical protein [Nostoc sp. LEGE 12447]